MTALKKNKSEEFENSKVFIQFGAFHVKITLRTQKVKLRRKLKKNSKK